MKRIISVCLSVLTIAACLTGMNVFAESNIEDLFEAREAYLDDVGEDKWKEFYYTDPTVSGSLTVLLYTDLAKELTFELEEDESGGNVVCSGSSSVLLVWGDYFITSPEVSAAIRSFYKETKYGVRRSVLRDCIEYFDISKEELMNAYKKMKEDPASICDYFDFMSKDDKIWKDKEAVEQWVTGGTEWPEFIIEALYLDDEELAYRLLCKPYSVYIPEIGSVMTDYEVIYSSSGWGIGVEELATFDMTTDHMEAFLQYLRIDGHIPLEKLEYLEAAREAQLKASQTGDGSVNALWVIAFVLPALAVVTVKRKRRM